MRENGLKKRTPKTITTLHRLLGELEKVRAQGYAVDDEENSMGARCLAAPVFDILGRVEAAVGLSGTTSQIDDSNMPKLVGQGSGAQDFAAARPADLGGYGLSRTAAGHAPGPP